MQIAQEQRNESFCDADALHGILPPQGRSFLYVSAHMSPDFLGDGEAARNFRVRNGTPANREI